MRARFAGDVRAPAKARSFVKAHLGAIVGGAERPAGDDIVLAVSELVTNSVRAGAATIDVAVQVEPERVDVRVTDDAEGWPTPRPATPDDHGGRGLSIVEQLADRWSAAARNPGKTVTATWFRRRRR